MSGLPILNGDARHELKMPVRCEHDQAMHAGHGGDLGVRGRDWTPLSLLLRLDASERLGCRFVERPEKQGIDQNSETA